MRLTVAALIPHALAIERVLQCVASAGIVSKVCTTTRSTSSSPIVRGAPGRGSSSKPSQPARRNRRRHLPTVPRVVPSSPATSRSPLAGGRLQHDPRPQDQRLRSLGPSYPALQFLPLSLRQIWNLSRVVVRHSRSPPQGRTTMAPLPLLVKHFSDGTLGAGRQNRWAGDETVRDRPRFRSVGQSWAVLGVLSCVLSRGV